MSDEKLRDALREGFLQGLQAAMKICDEEVEAMAQRLPDQKGGAFAKTFASNAIRGVRGRLNSLAKRTP